MRTAGGTIVIVGLFLPRPAVLRSKRGSIYLSSQAAKRATRKGKTGRPYLPLVRARRFSNRHISPLSTAQYEHVTRTSFLRGRSREMGCGQGRRRRSPPPVRFPLRRDRRPELKRVLQTCYRRWCGPRPRTADGLPVRKMSHAPLEMRSLSPDHAPYQYTARRFGVVSNSPSSYIRGEERCTTAALTLTVSQLSAVREFSAIDFPYLQLCLLRESRVAKNKIG